MEETILNFAKEFAYRPEVTNPDKLKNKKSFIVAGMGGSHLAAGLLKTCNPSLDIAVHKSYGLPRVSSERLRESLLIASSYSGNTEEIVDFAEKALEGGYSLAVIATGGRLLEIAKERGIPYVKLPSENIQPRTALGYSILGLAKLVGDENILSALFALEKSLVPETFRNKGKELAGLILDKIPVVYSSLANESVAYNWKIKFNETGKIPAFCNVFPELNHNEMTSFDVTEEGRALSKNFYFVFLKDTADDPRVLRRISITKDLFVDRRYMVTEITMEGSNQYERVFRSLILADWSAFYTAKNYHSEPNNVPMVEEFKKLMAKSQ